MLKQAIARVATEADEDTFADEDDDDLEDAFDEPDAVEPERGRTGRRAATGRSRRRQPSSTFAGPDVEPGPEQQRPSSN